LDAAGQARWARVAYPAEFQMPAEELVGRCGWRAKRDGTDLLVMPEERYRKLTQPQLLRMASVIDRSSVDRGDLYRPLDGWRIGEINSDPAFRQAALQSLNRGLGSGILPGVLQGASLAFQMLADDDFPDFVQSKLTPVLAEALPDFRLCLIDVHPRVHSRLSAIRGFFADRHTPDTLIRGPRFNGFGALNASAGQHLGTGTLITPALAATAPYGLGVSMSRLTGIAVFLYGTPIDFSAGAIGCTLADFLPVHGRLGSPDRAARTPPRAAPGDTVTYLRWWVAAADRLLGAALDDTNFVAADGTYRPAQHMGLLSTVERFLDAAQTVLNFSRRNGFARTLALFEALDLLEGLGLGDYDQTVSARRLECHIATLRDRLPVEVARIVLPRCDEAVAGLRMVSEGFRSTRRAANGHILVRGKNGQVIEVAPDKAVAAVLRAARNSGHGMSRILDSDDDLSLLEAHDGDIPQTVADVAFLHLIRVLENPESLVGSIRRRLANESSRRTA
jgi:hypothetical protein